MYLTRHGESLGNQTKSMGGDGNLSETGDRYAGVLADFVAAQLGAGQRRLLVWCSPMKRAAQTARAVSVRAFFVYHRAATTTAAAAAAVAAVATATTTTITMFSVSSKLSRHTAGPSASADVTVDMASLPLLAWL